MSIKDLASKLEKEINIKMDQFSQMGKKAKEVQRKLDEIYKGMALIAEELKPVEFMVKAQHPQHVKLFDMLLLEFKKEKNDKR
jgi:hypothetical protein